MIDYGIPEYFRQHGHRSRDIEKSQLFELLANEKSLSRKTILSYLKCRPNNVTEHVQELINDQIVKETSVVKEGKGRPEVLLELNSSRLVALSLLFESGFVRGSIVNYCGQIVFSDKAPILADVDNNGFYEALVSFITMMLSKLTKKQKLLGIGFALPGEVVASKYRWSFNAHFPNVRNMDFLRFQQRFNVPVRLFRLLDSQLLALTRENSILGDAGTLLVHWGDGIGASLSLNGKIMASLSGSCCEIGHVKVDRAETALKCRCGEKGCLETVAGGWVLLPRIAKKFGESFDLNNVDIANCSFVKEAIDQFTSVLDGVFRVCFPERILVYGPLFQNTEIQKVFGLMLDRKLPKYSKFGSRFEVLSDNLEFETTIGCTYDFFLEELKSILVSQG
ncbi:MAG: ROK family protein [Sphaerochaetaceae bacterium]|nr:ROK family protein [Sphaerochaetaceae bacterium]